MSDDCGTAPRLDCKTDGRALKTDRENFVVCLAKSYYSNSLDRNRARLDRWSIVDRDMGTKKVPRPLSTPR